MKMEFRKFLSKLKFGNRSSQSLQLQDSNCDWTINDVMNRRKILLAILGLSTNKLEYWSIIYRHLDGQVFGPVVAYSPTVVVGHWDKTVKFYMENSDIYVTNTSADIICLQSGNINYRNGESVKHVIEVKPNETVMVFEQKSFEKLIMEYCYHNTGKAVDLFPMCQIK